MKIAKKLFRIKKVFQIYALESKIIFLYLIKPPLNPLLGKEGRLDIPEILIFRT
jgi:hypothetical protein